MAGCLGFVFVLIKRSTGNYSLKKGVNDDSVIDEVKISTAFKKCTVHKDERIPYKSHCLHSWSKAEFYKYKLELCVEPPDPNVLPYSRSIDYQHVYLPNLPWAVEPSHL